MPDKVKSYVTIGFSVVVVCLIAYNMYTGATVQEIGIPGIFTISFRPKSEPRKAATSGTGQDEAEKSEKQKPQDHSDNNPTKSSGVYPRDLNISGSATAGEYTFRILSTRLEDYGQDEATHVKTLLLRLGIRETYKKFDSGWGKFSSSGFRLVLDDMVVSPRDCPDYTMDDGTSQDGSVAFILPENAQHVALRVGYYNGPRSDIPLALFTK